MSAVKEIIKILNKKNKKLAVAESLTGGKLSNKIVSESGASKVYQGGITSYTLEIKEKLLNIPMILTKITDGVDSITAKQMATSVAINFMADYSISTTGIAEKYDERPEQAFIAIYVRNYNDTSEHKIFIEHLKLDNLYDSFIYDDYIPREDVIEIVANRAIDFFLEVLLNEKVS